MAQVSTLLGLALRVWLLLHPLLCVVTWSSDLHTPPAHEPFWTPREHLLLLTSAEACLPASLPVLKGPPGGPPGSASTPVQFLPLPFRDRLCGFFPLMNSLTILLASSRAGCWVQTVSFASS